MVICFTLSFHSDFHQLPHILSISFTFSHFPVLEPPVAFSPHHHQYAVAKLLFFLPYSFSLFLSLSLHFSCYGILSNFLCVHFLPPPLSFSHRIIKLYLFVCVNEWRIYSCSWYCSVPYILLRFIYNYLSKTLYYIWWKNSGVLWANVRVSQLWMVDFQVPSRSSPSVLQACVSFISI